MVIIRFTQKKFTVSVVGIVQNPEGKVLILDHFIRPGTTWGLPGGFIDTNESPHSAIRRELEEETSLELENLELIQIRTLHKHIEILYRADGIGDVTLNSSEIRGYGWYALDSLPNGVSLVQRSLINSFAKDTQPNH